MGVSLAAAALVLALAVAAKVAITARTRMRTLSRFAAPEDQQPPLKLSAPKLTFFGRRERRGEIDVALCARAMARALRGGHSPVQALSSPGAHVPHEVGRSAQVEGLAAACAQWRSIDDRSAVRLLTTAVEVGVVAGGSLARALDAVADTVELRAAVAREIWAQAATARASAAVLLIAPVAFSGFALAGDGSAMAFLTGTPAGVACLATAVALDVAGACWMAKITAVA